ncbi:hypothetical protein [Streptacidiphilus jiangxiensis]|uniref:Uncharacterized protein n=1 Tax=Streptacidiphilus jiangxiensis TaxID=235985 RepID=A0A1H7I4Q0_STRJI|nr:hypothetical protein [Streptacidiphilus jiangxiensis]SEK55515.1 hypothetical protein SAMN05414137_102425 [Streptacidiphilus jiangxiensis]
MNLTSQILPLAGVVIGAATSFLVTALTERTRWKRQLSVRWDERRLGAYADYAHIVKELAQRYQRIAVARGLTTDGSPLEPTGEVLEDLAATEIRRSALSETVVLLGDTRTITASRKMNQCLWHLEGLARGNPTATHQIWGPAYDAYRDARQNFIKQARLDLGVIGSATDQATWFPDWHSAN